MSEWEYRKVDLNEVRPRTDELNLLNAAGSDGWELVSITSNNFAYMKRQLNEDEPGMDSRDTTPLENGRAHALDEKESAHGVKAKYRDPKTNETWSGRGRMTTWLKRKQDAGEDIDDYLV